MNEDGSTIFGDETAADVGAEEVAEAQSGSEASSEQLTGQQEHVVTLLVVFHTIGDGGQADRDTEEDAQAETSLQSQASHALDAPDEMGVHMRCGCTHVHQMAAHLQAALWVKVLAEAESGSDASREPGLQTCHERMSVIVKLRGLGEAAIHDCLWRVQPQCPQGSFCSRVPSIMSTPDPHCL